MQLTLQRYFFSDNYTLGRLYSGNHLICETLEPPSSHLNKHNPLRLIRKAKADGTWVDPKAAEAAKAEAAAKTLTGNGTMTAAPEVNGSAVTYTVSCEEVQ